jgi:FAD-linked oxidoreductase
VSPTWRNWTGDQVCEPAEYVRPQNAEEVAGALARAHARGWTARLVGAGHSFTPAVLTDGMLISLDRMNRLLGVDTASGLVRVEAGISLQQLSEALDHYELALENLGDVAVQSIAGATATATHGTGARLPNISANITSLEIVTADGSRIEIDEESDTDAWRAARVSIGALGVITALTLRAVPAFVLRGVDSPRSLDEVLSELDSLVERNEHFEFYTFPHSPLAEIRTNNRVDELPQPPGRVRSYLEDTLLENHIYGLTRRIGRRFPVKIPALNRIAARAWGSRERVDRSYRIFTATRRVRFTEMEYAIPRAHAVDAVRAVRAIADRKELRVNFPIEVRFVAPDDAFLSPATGRDTCYIAVHTYRGMGWEPYFRAVEQVMNGFHGRPHWGKRHFQNAEALRTRYPDWERFQAVRNRLDPQRRFTNDYVRRVLGD